MLSSAFLEVSIGTDELFEFNHQINGKIDQFRFQPNETDKTKIEGEAHLEEEALGLGNWYNFSIAFFSRLSGSSDVVLSSVRSIIVLPSLLLALSLSIYIYISLGCNHTA